MSETPTPAEWPRPFDAFLATITVANLTRSQKLMRVREFEASKLRQRFPGATDSDVKAIFLRRQRQPFATEKEWSEYGENYRIWWAAHVSRVNRRNSGLTKIRDSGDEPG